MKKILFLLFILFVGIFEVSALETSDQFKSIFIGYYHYVDEDGKFGDFEIFKRIQDEKIAYCIEPGVPLSADVYLGFSDLSNRELADKVGLSTQNLRDISLYSYYGYGYQNHKETAWLVATQVRIWEILGRKVQFTSRNSEADPFQYVIDTPSEIQRMIQELDALVSLHKEKPSIDSEKISIALGDTYTIQDPLLKEYRVLSQNPDVTLQEDVLTIHPSVLKEQEIFLEKENKYWSSTFIVYSHPIGQNLLLTGNVPNDSIHFYYEGIAGNLELQKFDSETKSCNSIGDSTLENAIYGLYLENGTLITKLKIHNCSSSYSSLALGNYYIQEIEAPYGYELDPKKYSFSVTKENISNKITLSVFDTRKKVSITIHKDYVEDDHVFLPEENATFDILKVSSNEVLAHLKTDDAGNAKIELPYDTYRIVQKTGKYNYRLSEEKVIQINDSYENSVISFLNEPIYKKVKVLKLEKNTNQKISIAGISFKIFDVKRNKYVCETKDCIYKTDENGEFITGKMLPSTYLLEEVQQKIPHLLWNSEKIEFVLNESVPDILEIPFYNEVASGSIEIIKRNEENLPLSQVIFHLFAKEDIFDIHKNKIYQKDELVCELITDDSGRASIHNLPLGNYSLKEFKTNDSYLLDEKHYDFSINYINEVTPIIEKKFEFINYSIPKTKKDFSIFPFLSFFLGGVLLYEKKTILFYPFSY